MEITDVDLSAAPSESTQSLFHVVRELPFIGIAIAVAQFSLSVFFILVKPTLVS